MGRFRKYNEGVIEDLKDRNHASAYLKAAFEDYKQNGNSEGLLLALKDIANVKKCRGDLANPNRLERESLYRIFSEKDARKLDTLDTMLKSLGFRLSVEPLEFPAS